MDYDQTESKQFIDLTQQAAKKILEIVKEDAFIHVFSHLDADGVSAAGIIGKMLSRLNSKFRLKHGR